MSCEQTNYWAGKYKHSVKHLSYERYLFFLYIIFEEFNNQKLINQKQSDFIHIQSRQQLDDQGTIKNQQRVKEKQTIYKFAISKGKRQNKTKEYKRKQVPNNSRKYNL